MAITIRDRSAGTQGSIQPHGCGHLTTSNKGVARAGEADANLGEGSNSQAPRIPSERPYTEVSIVEDDFEPCTAVVADLGGDAGNGIIEQGAQAIGKTAPVIARPNDSPTMCAVAGAHESGSITHKDHGNVHGNPVPKLAKPDSSHSQWEANINSAEAGGSMPSGDSSGVSLALDKVTKSAGPVVLDLGKSRLTNNSQRPSVTRQLSMSEVMDRRRHPEKYPPIEDTAVDAGLPVHVGRPVLTGDAVWNPANGKAGSV